MSAYKPGLHILSSFSSGKEYLTDMQGAKTFFDTIISELGLQKVGEAYHEFENGSFTAVICLTESHISIHTWPEFGHATFDVFLSNYQRDNSETVRIIHSRILEHFRATEISKTEVSR